MYAARAPATSANLGSGFDVFGVALAKPADVVRVEPAAETTIEVTGVGSQFVPTDPAKNTVGAVAEALDAPARIEIDKGVRPSSGLGSSAASAAAAALALDAAYDHGHTREELVEVAAEGERVVAGVAHQDNVAPALLGGFTIATPDGVVAVDADVGLVACLPELIVSTRDARAVLPDTVRLDEQVRTVGRAATLAVGMTRNDPELVGRGLVDDVVTPRRADLIEGYDEVRDAAIEAGATGVSVSGAGPSLLAVCRHADRRAVASAMVAAFEAEGIDATAYPTSVGDGAELFSL